MACRRSASACRTGRAPSSNWRRSALASAERDRAKRSAFGVYVHWPICLSKCPYCDFNSHVRHAPIDEERFARAVAREIETTAARAHERTVTMIFLGGGTRCMRLPQTVGAIRASIG